MKRDYKLFIDNNIPNHYIDLTNLIKDDLLFGNIYISKEDGDDIEIEEIEYYLNHILNGEIIYDLNNINKNVIELLYLYNNYYYDIKLLYHNNKNIYKIKFSKIII